jgi:hypothetical protein
LEVDMSWSFTAVAACKTKLKAHCRKSLTVYMAPGPELDLMAKVADAHDALIDLFQVPKGRLIKIESSGHVDTSPSSTCNCKIDLTNYLPLLE